MRYRDLSRLREDFIANAIVQGDSTYEGDYTRGNKASKKLFQIGNYLRENHELAPEVLDTLIFHENPNVRIWSCGIALDIGYRTNESETILASIANDPNTGILGLNAKMSLEVRKSK